jgi:hypothetical protein
LKRRAADLPEVGGGKRTKEGAGKPVLRCAGNALERRQKAHESIGFRRLRPVEVRIFAGSKALELRGIVTSWSSEQEHAMPETARGHKRRKVYGSAGGKSSVG